MSRYGIGGFTIQSVRSNDDHLVLRDRTGSDGSHCLVATELEANSKSLVPSIVTMHFLLLVRCQHVHILGIIQFDAASVCKFQPTCCFRLSNMPHMYFESQQAGSLFYRTNIAVHLPPLFRHVCGRPMSGLRSHERRSTGSDETYLSRKDAT